MSDLKATFVQRTLAQYMQECITAIKIAAQRSGVGVTDEAIKSLAYQAFQHSAQGGIANLSFQNVLRFVDMGVGRSHPLGGLKSMNVTLLAQKKTGAVLVKNKDRKAKKIYSKVVYGKLTWLQNKLLYGYTLETIDMLKEELQNAKQLNN